MEDSIQGSLLFWLFITALGRIGIDDPGHELMDQDAYEQFFREQGGKGYVGITVMPSWIEPTLQKLFRAPIGNTDKLVNSFVARDKDWIYAPLYVARFPATVKAPRLGQRVLFSDVNYYTVYALRLPYTYPKMVFDYKRNKGRRLFNFKSSLRHDDVVLCEGVFTKDYKVFAASGKIVEALAIASPELLIKIQDHSAGADVYVIDNFLYFVYDRRISQTPAERQRLFDGGRIIRDELINNYPRAKWLRS